MKKILLAVLLAIGLLSGGLLLLGVTPAYIAAAPGVATGIGTKLLCSARYVSGFSQEQAFDDLVQYSPILSRLSISYDEANQVVSTSLLGMSPKSAAFVNNLGCGVDYPGYKQRTELRTREITRSDARWPAGDEIGVLQPADMQLLQQLVARDNDLGLNTRALLVARNGAIVAEAYAQGATAQTPLLGWSMTKSLNSIMLANLEYRGLLDLESANVFPQWAGDGRAEIQISDLLTMTDGLGFSEEYNPGDDATAMLFTEASASDYVLQKSLAHPPGTFFNYSSGTANLLARLHMEILGGPQAAYDDYVANIRDVFAFQHAVYETDATGVFVGSSYLYASARDWARLGQFMLNGGEINGRRLVSPHWPELATSPNNSTNDPAYGYQFWLNRGGERLRWPSLPEDAFAAQGNRQQYLMIIPSLQLVIVRLGWTAGGYPVDARFAEIIAATAD